MTMRVALLALLLSACSVRESYVVAPETMQEIASRTPDEREHLAVAARRTKDGRPADVRASTLVLETAQARSDGVVVLSKLRTKRLVQANILVWTATPFSIAGTLMIILGHGAVRWSGIAMAGAAEPVLDVGTAFWVRGALAHPEELPRGLADVTYLPQPGRLP
jgi:hypothetical protein